MPTKKKHFYFLLSALVICCFICFDVYLAPTKSRQEVVIYENTIYTHTRKGGRGINCFVYTNIHKNPYSLPIPIYDKVNVGNTITISRSVLTNIVQKLSYTSNGTTYTSSINIMQTSMAILIVGAVILGIILSMIFYDSFPNIEGRSSMITVLCFGSIVLLALYIIINAIDLTKAI